MLGAMLGGLGNRGLWINPFECRMLNGCLITPEADAVLDF